MLVIRVAICAAVLAAPGAANAQLAVGDEIELETPDPAGSFSNIEHALTLTWDGTAVLATWNDAGDAIHYLRLDATGRPVDTTAFALNGSERATRVRVAFGGGSYVFAWIDGAVASGSATASAARIRADGTLMDEIGIGWAMLGFNHGFTRVGVAWDRDAFVSAAVGALPVTGCSYSEGHRIPTSGDAGSWDAPLAPGAFEMASNGQSALAAYVRSAGSSCAADQLVAEVGGGSVVLGSDSPRVVGVASNGSHYLVVAPRHAWQLGSDGAILHANAGAGIPDATELPIAAVGDGYVVAWSQQQATGDWEIRASRVTSDASTLDGDGISLVSGLRDEPHPVLCGAGTGRLLLGYERFDDRSFVATTRVRVRAFTVIDPPATAMDDAGAMDAGATDASADATFDGGPDSSGGAAASAGCTCATPGTDSNRAGVYSLAVIAFVAASRRRNVLDRARDLRRS